MKIVLSLFCVTLAMLFQPIGLKNESASSFRTINIHETENGYNYFDSMAITSSQDFKAFLEEISQQLHWNNRQDFVDALLQAKVDFDHEALVLLRHNEGSAGVSVSFETPVVQEKTLVCEIRRELRGAGPAVMAYHCFAFAVSKSLISKVQLNAVAVGGLGPERRAEIVLLSTTEREPFRMRRDPPPKPSPSECPKLLIGCPNDLLETGKTYLVKVLVEGGNPKDEANYLGNFNWSVTGAQIVGGQGTRALAIRINQPNKIVEVWVSLGGVNSYCDPVTSCSCGPTR